METQAAGLATYIITALLVVIGLLFIYLSFFTVKQKTAKIVERFGKFKKVAMPGLSFKVPFIDRIAGTVSTRVQTLVVEVETKTADDVIVTVGVSIQYQTPEQPNSIQDAFYKLSNLAVQLKAYVFDVIRAKVPDLKIDEVFQKKTEISQEIMGQLKSKMTEYGYDILDAPVTDINLPAKVKEAMNEIQAATRLRDAAQAKGDGDKILAVKKAEAEKETKRLQGEGIAEMRKAIANGFKESVETMKNAMGQNVSEDTILNMLLMTQYFDTLNALGQGSHTNTVFMPTGPSALTDLTTQIQAALAGSRTATEPTKE